MAYGTFSSAIANNYNKVNYTLNGKAYTGISIFKTNPSTMLVAPSCVASSQKTGLENLCPNGIAASNVIAKTNATPMVYGGPGTDPFYGLFYTANGEVWFEGQKLSGPSAFPGTAYNFYPSLCLKTDGTAIIRWFLDNTQFIAAYPYCRSIIAGAHPLVYGGVSVFEATVYSQASDGGRRIADWNDIDNKNYHFNNAICGSSAKSVTSRTFVGHKSDGSIYMVCLDTSGAYMDLQTGAKMMVDLGCDYAINEDGGGAVKMRVAQNYSGSYAAGQMTVGGTSYYGSAICAYLK